MRSRTEAGMAERRPARLNRNDHDRPTCATTASLTQYSDLQHCDGNRPLMLRRRTGHRHSSRTSATLQRQLTADALATNRSPTLWHADNDYIYFTMPHCMERQTVALACMMRQVECGDVCNHAIFLQEEDEPDHPELCLQLSRISLPLTGDLIFLEMNTWH